MAPSTGLPDGADLTTDYYALLSIPPTASESEIRRAYRKTSIKYHPDKVEPSPSNLEKFHQLQIALSLLTDSEAKAKYDQTREAKLRRKAEEGRLEDRRRKLKEDLERREGEAAGGGVGVVNGGAKRTWSEREMAINRIREENRRKMEEGNKKRVREHQEWEEAAAAAVEAAAEKEKAAHADSKSTTNGSGPTESIERSVKVRWVKEGVAGLEIDAHSLEDEFPAGEVENVVVLKDKKRKMGGRKDKVLLGTAVLVFASLKAAQAAIKRGPWDGVESVEWAAGAKDKDG